MMVNKFRVVSCLLLGIVFAPCNIHAAIIKSISISGNKRMDSESIRIIADVKTGDNITNSDLNDITKKIKTSGYFDSVDVDISGNALKISVKESPIVNQVTIEGNDEISLDDLKKELRTKSRDSFNESTVGADVQRMLVLYQRVGLYGTTIKPQKISLEDNRVNVVFEIKEGSPTYISDIEFTGNKVFSDRILREQILSRIHAWWKIMAQFDVYDSDRISYDQQLLRQFYMKNGYVDFVIKSANGTFNSDRTKYSIVIDVDEGNQYKFGKLSIKNPFPDVNTQDLNQEMFMESGDIYNVDNIEKTISSLRAKVAEYGYAFINVDVVPTKNDKDRTIDIVFDIKKTNRMYINNLNILGNVRTFDSVIEQLTDIRAGDPFSLNEIESARQRLMRSQYFKNVDMVPSRIPDSNLMNLDVRVDEQPTGELSGGVGWSNINGFMIDAGISEKNFMGRGQIVQVSGNIAQYQKQAAFSFTEPYLFGRQLSGGFDINYTMYNYSSLGSLGYDRDSFNIAGRLGWKLTDNWSQTVRLSATFDQNNDLYTGGEWKDANLYALSTNLKYYNLDTNFAQQTHTGVVGNLSVAYTGFGSTETFMRYGADITGLVKFFSDRWQLKSNLEFGYIDVLDGDYISRSYRYFLGGDSMRGFDVAGMGSRNWYYTTYALGGMWKINGTTQLNFPVFIPDEYQVKGFVFMDYGILGRPPAAEDYYAGYKNYIDQDWRASYGVGIYWNTPMGPMNFSWGWPLSKKSYDREQKFLLSFATQF
jgi:outer membrane protein insertion porin family